MKPILVPSALALTLMASGTVLAADPYVGGGVVFTEVSSDAFSPDPSLTGITGRLGSGINENISGEVRLTLGVDDDTVGAGFLKSDVELNSMIGAYLRAGVPMGPSFYPYAVLGFTRTELEFSNPLYDSQSGSETDVSYGLGVDLSLDRKMSLNVEYMNYFDKDDQKISGFSIGIASKI